MPPTTGKSSSRPDPPTGGEGFSAPGPRWTLCTPEGCRAVAELAVSVMATEVSGRSMSMMRVPAEVRVGYAARVLSSPIREANAWLAERADVRDRSRSRFAQKLRRFARELLLQDAGLPVRLTPMNRTRPAGKAESAGLSGGGASAERHL